MAYLVVYPGGDFMPLLKKNSVGYPAFNPFNTYHACVCIQISKTLQKCSR